jgi:hypothetical protein
MNAGHWVAPDLVMSAVLLMSPAGSTFISEDLACISAGVLVADGRMSFLFATFVYFVGLRFWLACPWGWTCR